MRISFRAFPPAADAARRALSPKALVGMLAVVATVAGAVVSAGAFAAAGARDTGRVAGGERARRMVPVPIPPAPTASRGARVLLVGTYDGIRGRYRDLRAAIRAARPGAWILLGPGDYREATNQKIAGAMGDDRAGAEFVITTRDIHIRGMDRNRVWLDGTRSGQRCSERATHQNFGPKDAAGNLAGRNGIVVYKTTGVSIENLSACNFLSGDLTVGDAIWFDGGGSSGRQTTMSFRGDHLTATSTYWAGASAPSANYGIYSSNTAGGPGVFTDDYASNMSDSDFYVGACPDCAVTLDGVRAEDSAEGYSGTNSGGVVIENSDFDKNRDGFDTNSQNNDDAPSPQLGSCPDGGLDPRPPADTQRIHSCWVFENNDVYDNDNSTAPAAGIEYNIPTGTGLSIYGGRYDIVTHNRFVNNGAWGILLAPEPDTEPPDTAIGENCQGGTNLVFGGQGACYFDDYGGEIANNTFTNDGYYGNNGNADIADISGYTPNSSTDGNCFHDNTDTSGTLTSQPANVDSYDHCGSDYDGETLAGPAGLQLACGSRYFGSCPPGVGANYPQTTKVVMPLPASQPTMARPCEGVPANPWCPARRRRTRVAA